MDCEAPAAQRRRKFRRTLILGVCLLFLLLVIAVSLGVALSRKSPGSSKDRVVGNFENAVITKCESFLDQNDEKSSGNTCEEVWNAFSGAYVGKDPCDVPMEAYDALINTVTQKDTCNRMLFWSKTKDIVHQFTDARKCLVTLEDTLLGSVMDGLTWCSKKGSKETFTTGCPEWMACERNPVRSFWNRVSAAFAESACGDVTVMLNGSISTPFHPDSIFGSIEVKRFSPPRMKTLNVVLVTKGNDTADCGNESLQDLQDVLNPSLKYTCTEVQRLTVRKATHMPDMPGWDIPGRLRHGFMGKVSFAVFDSPGHEDVEDVLPLIYSKLAGTNRMIKNGVFGIMSLWIKSDI